MRASCAVFSQVMTLANPLPQSSFEPRIPFTPVGATCAVRPLVPLAGFTSYRVGGPAEWFVSPRTLDDLRACFAWAAAAGLPVTLLGLGSNLLVSDRGLPGLVICTRRLRQTQFDEATGRLTAAAGEPIARLAWKAADRGWAGLEWAVGIPGTVGGAVAMNAGAHQACTADILVNAQLLTQQGALQLLTPADLGFRYRTSILQGDSSRLVTQATFQLRPDAGAAAVTAETRACQERRHSTQPYHLPSCGSVFRNPEPHTSGWLIEQTGLKGFQIGGAQVSPMHANFIVNLGNATASDVYRVIRHVQEKVAQRWDVMLEPEVKIWGEF